MGKWWIVKVLNDRRPRNPLVRVRRGPRRSGLAVHGVDDVSDFIIQHWLAFGTSTIAVVAPIAFWIIRRAWKRPKRETK